MSQPTENTRLLERTNQPQYVFDSSLMRERKRRARQFQWCACALFLSILVTGLVITIAHKMNSQDILPDDTSTTTSIPTSATDNNSVPLDSVLIILNRNLPLSDAGNKSENMDELDWKEAMAVGRTGLVEKEEVEKHIPSLQMQSPSYRHQKVVATSEKGRNLSRIGFVEEYATKHFYRHKGNNNTPVAVLCNSNQEEEYCGSRHVDCNVFQKYRSYNGSCNNLLYPTKYGVSYRPFRRVLLPDYADGISSPRKAKDGTELPSARTVSLIVHRPFYRDDPKFTVMLAIWGQFLDHDITATALSQKSNGSTLSCCDNSGITSPECFPVILDPEDPFREYNVSCMEFVRSAPAPTCCLGPREQLNQATPFIDGSVVYGHDENVVKSLRDMQNGTMKVMKTPDGRDLLPKSEDMNDGCNREEEERQGRYCFKTGDSRSNENLHLTTMHLIWVRHHNLVSRELQKLNPHWNDERIFQETRRIVAAQMQHITYNEFLPILLGSKLMKKFDLYPRRKGYFDRYNSSIDPSIANNFAASSFRFAHSIIPGLMKLLAKENGSPEYIQMHKMLFNPFDLYKPGALDSTLRGAMNTSIEASDSYFTDELKSHMFERSNEQINRRQLRKVCGLDLVSLNVQRGRDHGLPGYTKWRHHCGLSEIKQFDDLDGDMDVNSLHNIKMVYRHVDDIDVYTGALSEIPIEGSILGPTVTCLISDQFYRIKYGDRFWYENFQEPQAFTNEQLDELRKTSLAAVICDNADDLYNIQPRVMERISKKNNYTACSKIKRPNWMHWKEHMHFVKMAKQDIKIYSSAEP